jgi:hypothetical protein
VPEDETHARQSHDEYERGDDIETDATMPGNGEDWFVAAGRL